MPLSPKTKPATPARTSSASSRRPASKLTGRGPQRTRPDLLLRLLEIRQEISLQRLRISITEPLPYAPDYDLWISLQDIEFYCTVAAQELYP